ncbi:MAG: hypothetical protein M3Z06_13290 [Actinomycetota bacterium]|nr:hypothetical protein [Actinomycetota bacterium]
MSSLALGARTIASVAAAVALASCGGASPSGAPARSGGADPATVAAAKAAKPRPPLPSYPTLLGTATGSTPTEFVPAVRWRGRTAAWIARTRSGIGLISFDQRSLALRLHSGTIDPGGSGWRWGPAVAGSERHRLVAAFNGAFKFSTGAGGFVSYGRVGAPLRDGRGSIVTYSNGRTDIGSWHREVPATGLAVASVRQNLTLLIDHGRAATSVGCRTCWGATLGGVDDPARSALGVTASGHLVWAGGLHLSVGELANALLGANVVRAVELDINPEWVAGYLYGHRGGAGPLVPVPVVPGQVGVSGAFLKPYGRDFFAIVAR